MTIAIMKQGAKSTKFLANSQGAQNDKYQTAL